MMNFANPKLWLHYAFILGMLTITAQWAVTQGVSNVEMVAVTGVALVASDVIAHGVLHFD